jgi:hypothetical protein
VLQTHKLGATAYPIRLVLEAVTLLAQVEDYQLARAGANQLVQAEVFQLGLEGDNPSGRVVVNLLVQVVAKR